MNEVIVGAAKSKTVGFSLALVALGLLDQFTNVIPALVPTEYTGLAVAGVGLITALLRFVTTKPLSEK